MLDKTKAFFKSDPVAKRIAIHVGIVFGFLLAVWAASSVFEIRTYRFAEGWRSDLDPVTCTKDSGKRELSASVGDHAYHF